MVCASMRMLGRGIVESLLGARGPPVAERLWMDTLAHDRAERERGGPWKGLEKNMCTHNLSFFFIRNAQAPHQP